MMVNKKIIIITFAIIVIGITLIALYISKPRQITSPISNTTVLPEVIISTNKIEYDQGEIIQIEVENKFDTSIFYNDFNMYGDRFWGLEQLENGEWKNANEFQLAANNVGDTCHLYAYEMMGPVELKPNAVISKQWNQKICPTDYDLNSIYDSLIEYIKSGQYRVVFRYGFEIFEGGLSDKKTVYSKTFTIK